MVGVMRDELPAQPLQIGRGAAVTSVRRQPPLQHVPGAAPHHVAGRRERDRRQALLPQDGVEGGDEIGRGIDQRPVQIENDGGRSHDAPIGRAFSPFGKSMPAGSAGRADIRRGPMRTGRSSLDKAIPNRDLRRRNRDGHRKPKACRRGARPRVRRARHAAGAGHRLDRAAFRRASGRADARRLAHRGGADLRNDAPRCRALAVCR